MNPKQITMTDQEIRQWALVYWHVWWCEGSPEILANMHADIGILPDDIKKIIVTAESFEGVPVPETLT